MGSTRIDSDAITRAALDLLDAAGTDALTVNDLAARLDVGPSALYRHVDGIETVRSRVIAAVAEQLVATVTRAAVGRSGEDALLAIARAYRAFAAERPGRYALVAAPSDVEPDLVASHRAMTDVLVVVLRTGYGLDGDDAVHAARTVRSALHGFVTLESTAGFARAEDLDASFEHLTSVLLAGLAATGPDADRWPGRSAPTGRDPGG